MLQGNRILLRGLLLLERLETAKPPEPAKDPKGKAQPAAPPPSSVITKLFALEGSYCLSMADLDTKTLDVGRIGYENSWKEVPFEFQVKNLSESQLMGRLGPLPAPISVQKAAANFRVQPYKQRTIKAMLQPRLVNGPRLITARGRLTFLDPESNGRPLSVHHSYYQR